MAGYWPTADSDPASPRPVAEFARIWRTWPKIVYSRTLERADWNTTVVRDVIPEEVMELKAQPGGDMVVGGADVAAAFMRHDLIDEYRLYVHPVVIGKGKPLFPAIRLQDRPPARREPEVRQRGRPPPLRAPLTATSRRGLPGVVARFEGARLRGQGGNVSMDLLEEVGLRFTCSVREVFSFTKLFDVVGVPLGVDRDLRRDRIGALGGDQQSRGLDTGQHGEEQVQEDVAGRGRTRACRWTPQIEHRVGHRPDDHHGEKPNTKGQEPITLRMRSAARSPRVS